MSRSNRPTLEEFLAAPIAEVREVAPATMIIGAGGTRRQAVLNGISSHSEEYPEWTRRQMVACFNLIFRHGVQHLVTPTLVAGHAAEITPGYRDKLMAWTARSLSGPAALADYARYGWRVRLLGHESWPELEPVAAQVAEATETNSGPTVWFSVASSREQTWARILHLAVERQITDLAALIEVVYGEPIPPATLYLGTGKPQVEDSLIPPLLAGKMECYWRQHLGYDLDEKTLRTILYDFAYVRPTWRADKTGRAEQVQQYAAVWKDPAIVGLGVRFGPFWYPAPIAPAPTPDAAREVRP